MAKRKRKFEVVQRPNLGYLGGVGWIVMDGYQGEIAALEDLKNRVMDKQYFEDVFGAYAVARN